MYFTVMRHQWPNNGPIPVDEIEALIEKPWLSTSEMFRRRFVCDGGMVSLQWVEDEREKKATFSAVQAAKGRKGGRPSKGIKPGLNQSFTKDKPNKSPRVGVGNGIGIKEEKEHAGESFENAFAAYGRHGSKQPAIKSWAKLNEADRTACVAAIPAYVKNTNTDGTFPSRKHFATYLNQRAWEDVVVPVVNGNGRKGPMTREEGRVLLNELKRSHGLDDGDPIDPALLTPELRQMFFS